MTAVQPEFRLHSLCSIGKVDDIFNYLESNNSEINQYDKRGYAPIHYAVGRDTADIEQVLSLLFTHNVDVNLRTLREGDTPLHIVATRFDGGDAAILVLKLLSLGADPDYRNDNQRTVYDIAMAKGDISLAEMIQNPLSQEEAAKQMTEEKVEHYGEKLITLILGEGSLQDVQACLDAGADTNFINKNGAAAIHYTITHSPLEKLKVLQSLIDAKADVNIITYEKDNALNLVIKTTSLRDDDQMYLLVAHLLEWGSSVNQRDLDGKDALALAREREYDDIVSLLITHGGARQTRPTLHGKRPTKQIEMSFKGTFE